VHIVDRTIKLFWVERKKWPSSTLGWTFLLNAVDPIGKALFPGSWLLSDPITDEEIGLRTEHTTIHNNEIVSYHLNTSFSSARRYQKDAVARLLKLTITHGPFGPDHSAVEANWKEGSRLAELEDERRRGARERYDAVKFAIKAALLDGELKSATLPKGGGSYRPLSPDAWNTDVYLDARFAFGQIDPQNTAKPFVAGTGYRHIFVDEAGLRQLLSRLMTPGNTSAMNEIGALDPLSVAQGEGERPISHKSTAYASVTVASRSYSSEKVADWLSEKYLNRPQPPEQEVIAAAKSVFPGIGREAVRTAIKIRRDALNWTTKPGPRGPRGFNAG
jgi:hypothetical protein